MNFYTKPDSRNRTVVCHPRENCDPALYANFLDPRLHGDGGLEERETRYLQLEWIYKFLVAVILFFSSAEFAIAQVDQSYFDIDSISPQLFSPTLVINSPEWRSEVSQILKMQKNLDLEDLDQAVEEKHLQPETIAQKIDPKLTRADYPKLYHLLDRVGDTSRGVTDNIKAHFDQTRPYLADSRIKMLISPSKGGSYPSGHATGSYIYAHVMSLLIPQQREEFQNLAEKIAQHRILIGMHYPRDIRAGKELSFLVIGGLTQSSDFQKDLGKAALEIMEKKKF